MIFRLASIVLSILGRKQRSELLGRRREGWPPNTGTGAAGTAPSISFGGAVALADTMIATERLDQKTKPTKI